MTFLDRAVPAALAAWLCAGCAGTPGTTAAGVRAGAPDPVFALARSFDSLRQAQGIPGLAVVILRDTTVVLARGFGYADLTRGVPVTPETPFNIASVAKPISAVVALRLVEAGRLDLDRPMQRYRDFTEFCADARGNGGIFFADYPCDDPGSPCGGCSP